NCVPVKTCSLNSFNEAQSQEDCDQRQFCWFRVCLCQPQYEFSQVSGKCLNPGEDPGEELLDVFESIPYLNPELNSGNIRVATMVHLVTVGFVAAILTSIAVYFYLRKVRKKQKAKLQAQEASQDVEMDADQSLVNGKENYKKLY